MYCVRVFGVGLAVVAGCIGLGGCVVGPDYMQPAVSLPNQWATAKGPARPPELSHWWQRFGDPLLNALIEEGISHNLDVAAARARIREARATYRQSVGGLLPFADAGGAITRSKSVSGSSSSGAQYYTQYQAGFDASWEADIFGANKRAIEAAAYGLDASEEDLRATQLTLIGDIASNYVALRGYQTRIALARRTADSQKETAALTRRQLEAGSASSVDVARAVGLAASTEANVPALETSYAETVHRLSVLTGRAPGALAGRLKPVRAIPQPKALPSAGVPADVLITRPDVRLAERQYAQATAKIGQAEAARYPSVSLTGNIATTALSLGDLGKASTIGWSFGPSLSVPIFQGGQLRAAVDIAKAQRDQYFLAYHSVVLEALEDVENSAVALGRERQRNRKLASAAASYREASNLSRQLYQGGSSDFLDVLDAERSAYSAEDALLVSRVAIATNYIALMKALGGGWDGEVDGGHPAVVDANTGPHFWRPAGGA